MLRVLAVAVALCAFVLTGLGAPEERFVCGDATLTLDPENTWLPVSAQWKGVELLHGTMGVNHFFTSFEFRNKFYRGDNRNTWPNQKDPRFATDIGPATMERLSGEGFAGAKVRFENSYARVERAITIGDGAKGFTLNVAYRIEARRDFVIHETEMFGLSVRLNPDFKTHILFDAREGADRTLTVEGDGAPGATADLLNSGVTAFIAPEKKVGVLASATGNWADGGAAASAGMTEVKTGRVIELRVVLLCMDATAPALTEDVLAAGRAMPARQRAFALTRTARALLQMKKPDEAEPALLRAAELNKEYATPYALLAAIRRDSKTTGTLSQTEAWVEGAYRSPYNYGYILSGGGFWKDKRLTEEQRRLAVFNMLMAVENTLFYADYYIWAARPFEEMKMYAQACAMYRQALWAVDRLPRTEEHKEKCRKQFRDKIAELERKLTEENYTAMPPLLPVRAPQATDRQP